MTSLDHGNIPLDRPGNPHGCVGEGAERNRTAESYRTTESGISLLRRGFSRLLRHTPELVTSPRRDFVTAQPVSWDDRDGRRLLHRLFVVLGLVAVSGWLLPPWWGLA